MMTLDIIKSEALKLGKEELYELVQFIIGTLKEKDSQAGFQMNTAQLKEVENRLNDMQSNPSVLLDGYKAEEN
jgi:hypothetical protein